MATMFRMGVRAFSRRSPMGGSSATTTAPGAMFRSAAQRRATSTSAAGAGQTAGGGGGGQQQQQQKQAESWFARMWNSPIGFKTVHFWAPVMKWAIVLAGISDFARPVEKLSLTQNLALTATGTIWTRWCFIIKPKNYLLAAVNFFLAIVGTAQVTRILAHQQSLKNEEKKSALVAATKV